LSPAPQARATKVVHDYFIHLLDKRSLYSRVIRLLCTHIPQCGGLSDSHRRRKMITRIAYRKLRREERHTFNNYVKQIIETTCGPCGKVYEAFLESAHQFDYLLQGKASKESLSLAILDYAADEAWVGLSLQIQASLKHPNATIREAAAAVDAIFSQTPNPTRLNYDQEYGTLATLLAQLRQIDVATRETACVEPFIQYLSDCVDSFVSAAFNVNDAKSKQTAGELKEASESCYRNWTSLAKYLEAMHCANALPDGDNCIAQLDTLCKRVKSRIVQRTSAKKDDDPDIFADDSQANP